MAQQAGGRPAAKFHFGKQYRPDPLRLRLPRCSRERCFAELQLCRTAFQPTHHRIVEALLDLAGEDQLAVLDLAEIDAVKFAALIGEPHDGERLPMPTSRLDPSIVTTGSIAAVFALRHDPLQTEEAGLSKDHWRLGF